MKRIYCAFAVVALSASLLAPVRANEDRSHALIKQAGYTVSLELKFTRKKASPLQRFVSVLDYGPNGFATGFHVGDGLVMTAYHVVSGDVSISKKAMLGFGLKDELSVSVEVNGCQATVVKVDEEADLALLSVCQTPKAAGALAFQPSPDEDEKLLLIARPRGGKLVRRGIFSGTYMRRGMEYLSARIETRDGDSGSPVFNYRAELIGVLSSYDRAQKLAVISPGTRAQKLLEEYLSSTRP